MMRRSALIVALIVGAVSVPRPALAQAAADSAAIRAAAMDYIEGWYAADGARMERALHPELAKRIIMTDKASGRTQLQSMGAMTLVGYTKNGGGSRTPAARQQKDFTLLDIYQNAAVAKVVASDWVDYLQLGKWNGRWVIVNVLWEMKPVSP
ncbi:MAG: nuclear transport factor 2 family protein [Gemmatimonadaceae bacterium]